MPQTANIVVATDFSDGARHALRRAALIARRSGAPLVVVHVFNDGLWASIRAELGLVRDAAGHTAEAAQARLAQLRDELLAEFGAAFPVRTEMLSGRAARAIGEYLTALPARLLVVGEHGENWVREAVLGGTALKLLENTRLPVLLVRRPATGEYARIVVATDFSPTADRAAQLAQATFPEAWHCLLHAYSVHFEGRMRLASASDADIERYREHERINALNRMQTFVARHRPAEPLLVHGYPATALLEQARTLEADLIVLGKHGGGTLEENLLGSVTQNVLYHAGCDVLLSP